MGSLRSYDSKLSIPEMKIIKNTLLWLLFVCIVFFAGVHAFLNLKGRDIIEQKLTATFQQPVKVGSVVTHFPFALSIRDVRADGFFEIEEIVAENGVLDAFNGDFILSGLVIRKANANFKQPVRNSRETTQVTGDFPDIVSALPVAPTVSSVTAEQAVPLTCPVNFQFPRVAVKHLEFVDSTFTFSDPNVSDSGLIVVLEDVNAKIENFLLPVKKANITSFKAEGKFPWKGDGNKGSFSFTGWIDVYNKDMRSNLSLKGIDALHFYPYFHDWINKDKANLQKAKLNFDSDITGLNNDVTMDCRIELIEVEFKPREDGTAEAREERVANAIFDMFRALNNGKVIVSFKFKTKMDSPEFGFGVIRKAIEGKIIEARVENSKDQGLPRIAGRVMTETVTTVADVTKSLISAAIGIGKELTRPFSKGKAVDGQE